FVLGLGCLGHLLDNHPTSHQRQHQCCLLHNDFLPLWQIDSLLGFRSSYSYKNQKFQNIFS
ncbi:hypothetical protein, partial [Moraxella catarrhalis]|uniref:hypothetical protein n=1 Tax=Moraxella catarrhalis TaxID=480 RepID=UPI001D0D9846